MMKLSVQSIMPVFSRVLFGHGKIKISFDALNFVDDDLLICMLKGKAL